MPDPKKETKKTDENCNEKVADNYMGCLDAVSKVKKWDLVEVKRPKDNEGPERVAGVIMGESHFIEFVNKAIVSYMGKAAVIEMMQDILSGEKENEPTEH